MRDLTHEQKEPKKRVPITADEYRRIMAWPTVDMALGKFMTAATAISYWTGLRLADIASLEWPCFNGTELIVWTGKRDKRVAMPLSNPLIGSGELKMVLLGVAEDARPGARYIFPDAHKIVTDPTDRAKVSVYYGRLLDQIGIEGKSFHCLRHAFVTRLTHLAWNFFPVPLLLCLGMGTLFSALLGLAGVRAALGRPAWPVLRNE